ncbi:MAG: hypothetical protein ACRDM1_00485 [Gaiellaceae bacterium]
MTDEITLTFPRGPDFHPVAHLVLSGLAVRLDLTVESLEDLQLALDALLDQTDPGADLGELTVSMILQDHELQTRVGPLGRRLLDEIDQEAGDDLSLRRVLESTVDDVLVDGDSVRLTKLVARG